jgi:hypothetical protein
MTPSATGMIKIERNTTVISLSEQRNIDLDQTLRGTGGPCLLTFGANDRYWPFATCGLQTIVGRFRSQADIRQLRSLTAYVANDAKRTSTRLC